MPKTPPENSKLLVISFEDGLRAQEFLLAVARLQHNDEIQLHDAVLIARDDDGRSHVRETSDVTPGQAGVGDGVWGLLLGTLFGRRIGGVGVGAAAAGGVAMMAVLTDTGVKDETIQQLRTTVP